MRVLIIGSFDGFANTVWPTKIQQYISQKGHKVDILDTMHLSRLMNKKFLLGNKLPKPSFCGITLYALELIYYFFVLNLPPKYKMHFSYLFITSMMKLRGKSLSKAIQKEHYNLIICTSQLDSCAVIDVDKRCQTLFSCPTPFADELYYEKLLTDDKRERFRSFEMKIYKSYTYVSFHWDTYANYVEKYYKYAGKNIIKLNKGTEEASSKASYNVKPRIIYFGKLDGNWINLPLLSTLSKVYPIDVYGSPVPDPKYGLNYKGYATSDILSEFQFGLITITDDDLRKEGFSAKHLDYLSHGLPVLVPEWRENAINLKGTILFNNSNFLKKIECNSTRERWAILHEEALKQASELTWENTLKALGDILESPSPLPEPV